jgi:predicted RNase H-like HicB family nuclease
VARYIAIIDYDAKSKMYGAYFPDAPGCTAMGASEEEVVANAFDALDEWVSDLVIEGVEVPKPRSYAQLLKSKDYPELGKGGLVATIPLVREYGRMGRANISMDVGILSAIDEEARRRGITRSTFLADAARAKLKDHA